MAWLIATVIGLLMVAFNRQLAALIVREQNRVWRLGMGERSFRATRFVTVVVGASLVTLGVLAAISG